MNDFEQISKKYKENSHAYNFPNQGVASSKKDEAYCRAFLEAMWCKFINNRAGTSLATWDDISMNRLYGAGKQPPSIYHSWATGRAVNMDGVNSQATSEYDLSPSEDYNTALRKGWNNVDFSVHSFIPKIKASIKAMLSDVEYDVKADPVDPFSKQKQEDSKWMTWAYARHLGFIAKYKASLGLPMDDASFIPESLEELDMYEASEGFKVNYAKAMEKVIRASLHASGYPEEKDMWIDDLLDTEMAASMDYVCPETKQARHKYVDVGKFVIQQSQYADYRDAQWGGHVEMMPLSLLANYIPHDAMKDVAHSFVGLFGNPPESEWDKYAVAREDGTWGFYFFKVPVLHAKWIDTDNKYTKIVTNKFGNIRSYDVDETYKPKNKPNERLKHHSYRMVYTGSMIIGSGICFNCGHEYVQPRKGGEVRLPYHVYSLPYKGLIRTLRPLADEFMKTWITYQNNSMIAIKEGYAINMHMFQNVPIKGKRSALLGEIIEFWKETGVLPYSYSLNGRYEGGAAMPITPIAGAAIKAIENAIARFQFITSQVSDVTGINPISIGSMPSPSTQVRTAEIGVNSTMNVLKPIISGCFKMKDSISRNICYRVQNQIRYDKEAARVYKGVLSESDVMMLKEAEDNNVEYSIILKTRPTASERQALFTSLKEAKATGQINIADEMFLQEQLMSGVDLKSIRQFLSYKISKWMERQEQQQLMAIREQNAGIARIEQQKVQTTQATTQLDFQTKSALSRQEHEQRMKEDEASDMRDFQKQGLKIQGNIAQENVRRDGR